MQRKIKQERGLKAWRRGYLCEKIALWLYTMHLYTPLAHRFKTPFGEIDVIIKRGKALVFLEVKQRQNFSLALESLQPTQQQRLRRAALFYLKQAPTHTTIRFDLIVFNRWFIFRRYKNVL